MKRYSSPYLVRDRLAFVIAALIAMGHNENASSDVLGWTHKLGDPGSVTKWSKIFSEHPEFFAIWESSGVPHAMLRWRYTYKDSRPLKTEEISMLIQTAIEMHSSSIAQAEESRWLATSIVALITALFGFAGAVIGSLLGG